jgi:hypothetical protein
MSIALTLLLLSAKMNKSSYDLAPACLAKLALHSLHEQRAILSSMILVAQVCRDGLF